jgi:hypothetical protein
MIRYRYAKQLTPPTPFVYVSVGCVATGGLIPSLPAQIDTAALNGLELSLLIDQPT